MHFKEAQTELKAIWGPTTLQAGYHHANYLDTQLREELQGYFLSQNTEMLAMLQSIATGTPTNEYSPPPPTSTYIYHKYRHIRHHLTRKANPSLQHPS